MPKDMEKIIELETAIRFKDLLSTGSNFQINHEHMADLIDQEIFDEAGSDDDDNEIVEDFESKISPWKKSFAELKAQMESIPCNIGSVYKRIITEGNGDVMKSNKCRMEWVYSMFFENESNAFDSISKPAKIEILSVLPGIQIAVQTMRKKEEAQFVIDYRLMYGKLGSPPRIKPESDVLLVIKLNDFDEIGDENAFDGVSEEDTRKYHVIKDKINDLYKKSLDNIKYKRYANAIKISQMAVQKLNLCQVADEKEEAEQQALLDKLYIQLSDCYIHVENWKKCCLMVNELHHRKFNRNVKVMLNEAIALSHIEDSFDRSIRLLRTAQEIEPQNGMVNKTLAELLTKNQKYKQEQQDMWRRALAVKEKAGTSQK